MKIAASVAFVLLLSVLPFTATPKVMAASEISPSEAELCLLDFKKVPRMSIDELKAHLDDPSVVVIDVRSSADWDESSVKIKRAVRQVYAEADQWASRYDKDKTVVLYCA